jgi:tRNA (Thr-GGU) A37 N-methylase
MTSFEVRAIGWVSSNLKDLESAPRQADEGAPEAWFVFDPEISAGLQSLKPGDHVLVLTWLDRARRDIVRVHPRGDAPWRHHQ